MGAVLRIDILADGSKAASVMDKTAGKVGKFAKAAALGAAGVAVAVGGLAVSAIQSASETEQALGATESIFGKHAAAVEKTARGAADSVGLATSEYANLANVLGAQLKNMGTSADKLGPKTESLIGLGADLAATFGGTTADAVSAVSSLLKGERDPIERYGVSIKAADVAARLAAQGLDKLTGPAKAQAEAQATLALLTQQTATSQGAFNRESGTAAGQQQRLTAQWENAKSTLGSGLLPTVTKFATFLSTRVLPAVQAGAATLAQKLGPAFNAVGGFITTKVVPAARSFYSWFQQKIMPGIRAYVTPAIAGLSEAWGTVSRKIKENEPQLRKIGTALKTVAEFVASKVLPIVGQSLGMAFKGLGLIIGGVIDTIGWLVDKLQSAYEWITKLVDKLQNSKAGKVLGHLGVPGFGLMAAPAPAPSPTYGLLDLSPGLIADSPSSTSSPTYLQAPAPQLALPDVDKLLGGLRTTVVNHFEVNVDGALDPVAVAEQIEGLLRQQARRMGRGSLVGAL